MFNGNLLVPVQHSNFVTRTEEEPRPGMYRQEVIHRNATDLDQTGRGRCGKHGTLRQQVLSKVGAEPLVDFCPGFTSTDESSTLGNGGVELERVGVSANHAGAVTETQNVSFLLHLHAVQDKR